MNLQLNISKKLGQANKLILITGSGSIANKHIHILLELNYKILILIKSNTEKKRFLKSHDDKIKFIKNLDDIDANKIFFAIIASSTYKHKREIELCLKKKINIFCEKPISNNLQSLKKIRKKIIDNKNFFFVNYQLKQHTLVKKLKMLIRGKKIYHIEARVGHNLKYWRSNKIRNSSYYVNSKKGGGVIFELIHEINLIKYIFGHITKIKTIKNSFALKKTEDHALSIFKTIKNIPGTLIQDMLSERKERYFKVLTTKNTITLDFIQNKIFILNNKSSKTIKNKYKDDQLNLIRKNIKYYIEWIKRGEFNISLFDEAVKDLKICKKMHEKF